MYNEFYTVLVAYSSSSDDKKFLILLFSGKTRMIDEENLKNLLMKNVYRQAQ